MTIIQKGEPMSDFAKDINVPANDCISRQAAIDAIFSEPLYKSGMKKRDADEVVLAIYEKIKSLPPVYVPEMNVGDMISRQAAIEMLMNQNVIMDGAEYHNGFNAGVNRAQEVIRNLPPVQTEIIHCKDCLYKKICSWKSQGATFCSFGKRGEAE